MSQPVSSIRNLGPATEAAFANVGIRTADALRNLGTDAAYELLLRAGQSPHFIGYYVIEMGLQGRPWTDCTGSEKIALRKRFDAIKARVSTRNEGGAALDAALDEIGVIVPGRRSADQPTSSRPEKK